MPTNAATRFRQNLDSVASGTEDLLERLLEREPIASERLRPPRLLEAMRYASLGGGKRTLARHSALTARAND